jgi:hypothetical protein
MAHVVLSSLTVQKNILPLFKIKKKFPYFGYSEVKSTAQKNLTYRRTRR